MPKQVNAVFGLDLETKPQRNQETPNRPREAVDELNLLFSGVQRSRQLTAEFPQEPIHVPEIDGNLQGTLQIGNSPKTLDVVIQNYKLLKKNLQERRKNLSITLEGYVQPHEALDLFSRIDALNEALLKIEQNLEKAVAKKAILEQRQREQDQAVRQKLRDAEEAKAHREYKVYVENGTGTVVHADGTIEEGVPTETLRQA